MNNRERMRASNKLCREWLLKNGYDEIWFKPHGKHNDYVFTQKGTYMAQDIWNLFDGVCINKDGYVTFLQMSTTQWHKKEPYHKFTKKISGVEVLNILVTNKRKECNGKYKVFVREF